MKDPILAVRHRVLNGNNYDMGQLLEDTLSLEKYTHGRSVVPCFEGDIVQVKETGDVVLTHSDFTSLPQKKYNELKDKKLASSLEDVLDKIAAYKQKNCGQKIVLCFDSKSITSKATIDKTVSLLKEYGIKDAYFDSFFGEKLDAVQEANNNHKTHYARSLHLFGNIGKSQFKITPAEKEYDILTIPYPMSFGDVGEPAIYGAVGSADILKKIAENPQVQGAYIRFQEGAGIKGNLNRIWNSVTNTKK